MNELREVFEIVTKQAEPDLDSWKQQQERQRRSGRNRRIGAIALVAALAIALGVFALASLPGKGGVPAQSVTPSPIPELAPDAQDVEIVDLQGNPQALVPGLPADAYGLSLSSDGSKIAFVTDEGLSRDPETHPGAVFLPWRIAIIGSDGTGMRVLDTGAIAASMPAWSRDGTMIAFEGASRTEPPTSTS